SPFLSCRYAFGLLHQLTNVARLTQYLSALKEAAARRVCLLCLSLLNKPKSTSCSSKRTRTEEVSQMKRWPWVLFLVSVTLFLGIGRWELDSQGDDPLGV